MVARVLYAGDKMSLKNNLKDLVRRMTGEIPTKTLIKRGLKVGTNFNRQQGCFIDPTHCFLIEIGNNVTMSIRVVLMAHDASTKKALGYTKIGKIKIGDNVFIGANSVVLPNVTIGDNVVIGANSVVTKDVEANTVIAGNPAKVVDTLDNFKEKNQLRMDNSKVFDSSYRMNGALTEEGKNKIREAVECGIAFIE